MSFGGVSEDSSNEGWDEDLDIPVASNVNVNKVDLSGGNWDDYIEDGVNGEGDEDWEEFDEVPSVQLNPIVEEDEDWGDDIPVAGSNHASNELASEGWDVAPVADTPVEDIVNIPTGNVASIVDVPVGRVSADKDLGGFIPAPPSAVRGKVVKDIPVGEEGGDVKPSVEVTPVEVEGEEPVRGEVSPAVQVKEVKGEGSLPSVEMEGVPVEPVSTPVILSPVDTPVEPTPVVESSLEDSVSYVEEEGWGDDIPVAGGSISTGLDKVSDDWWEEDVVSPDVMVEPVSVSDVSEPLPVNVLNEPHVAVIPAPPEIVLDTPGESVVSRVEEKKNAAAKPAVKKKRKSNTIGGIRLTSRDLQMMGLLARYRFATVSQLAKRFETSETALRNRLPRLEKAGLLTFRWAAQTQPKLWMITEKGLQTVGMTLTAPKVDYPQLRHGLGLVDLGISFELAGEIVVTEREIRAAATRYMPTPRMRSVIDMTRFMPGFGESVDGDLSLEDMKDRVERSLILPMPATHARGHIPDMVVARQPFPNGASGNIAVELELTRKPIPTWKDILTAYRDSTNFAQVYYFVMDKEIGRALKKVVEIIGAEDKIMVEAITPRDLSVREG